MSPDDLQPALDTARRAVAAAGRIQLAGLESERRVMHKSRFDLLTEVDQRCEEAVLGILREAYPQAVFLAEESSPGTDRDQGEVWLVDPLDGTTNYARGYPAWCTTVALRRDGETLLGVVYDALRDERFEAVRGRGASLNGKPIRVSRTAELGRSLLATGFPYDRCEQPETNLERFSALTMRTQGVRRGGSASLDLCYTACGRLDGYWELRIFPWDVVAGALLVEEAGGKVSDLAGGPFDGSGAQTLATNGLIHTALVDALAGSA
ncbi:MAG: inositol monophosphatase [Deltaproteobacteria bacterium]|nr:inositol monophosphatase [Deltaproteobacteria bacterium]